jgi:hypothetical protein
MTALHGCYDTWKLAGPDEGPADPNLCRNCEKRDVHQDGLCYRCAENAEAMEYVDVAALVKAARQHLSLWNQWPSALGAILDRFPDPAEAAV